MALANAHTLLDGPRTDVVDHTRIWVGRWGAPVRIRDALGAETRIRRNDAAFPALATEVVTPAGLRTEARYDARGRVDTTIVYNPLGDGQNAVSTFVYDDRWDAPDTVSTPGVGPVIRNSHTRSNPARGARPRGMRRSCFPASTRSSRTRTDASRARHREGRAGTARRAAGSRAGPSTRASAATPIRRSPAPAAPPGEWTG